MTTSDDSADIFETALRWPPVDTRYRWGMHHHRATLAGVWIEAKVFAKSLVTPPNRAVKKFVIVGPARSGSTLLTNLLHSQPDIHCDREVLRQFVVAPTNHLECLARKSSAAAYGAKILSYQMVQVHRFRDPIGFLRGLQDRGWLLIHLHRRTFDQTLSLTMARKTRTWHKRADGGDAPRARVLDPADFCRQLEWNDLLLRWERRCFGELDHIGVGYEADLLTPDRQQKTIDRLCAALGIMPVTASTELHKILPGDARNIVENYDDVVDAMRARGLGHLVPAAEAAFPSGETGPS